MCFLYASEISDIGANFLPLFRARRENFYKEMLKTTNPPSFPQKSVGSGEVSSNTADIVKILFLSLKYA